MASEEDAQHAPLAALAPASFKLPTENEAVTAVTAVTAAGEKLAVTAVTAASSGDSRCYRVRGSIRVLMSGRLFTAEVHITATAPLPPLRHAPRCCSTHRWSRAPPLLARCLLSASWCLCPRVSETPFLALPPPLPPWFGLPPTSSPPPPPMPSCPPRTLARAQECTELVCEAEAHARMTGGWTTARCQLCSVVMCNVGMWVT